MTMTLGQGLICFGLCLDIAGVILLYRYGLPSRYPKDAGLLIIGGVKSTAEDGLKRRRFEQRSLLGIVLLVIGFVCQMFGTAIQ